MRTKVIEVTNDGFNWGKMLLARFDDEWEYKSAISGGPLLRDCGWWDRNILWVLDLQTGEGALFTPGGYAKADLEKHRVWVCPMYEPLLEWLYKQDLSDLDALPSMLNLKDAPAALYGYRRPGPEAQEAEAAS